MFDLERAITEWKKQLHKNRHLEDGDKLELESHLRDHIEASVEEGISEKMAFERACQAIGALDHVGKEIRKSNRLSRTARPGIVTPIHSNFFKVYVRQFLQQKMYGLIHLTGLSIGFAASLVILIFVHFELSFDNYHDQVDEIHRLVYKGNYREGGIAKIVNALGPELQAGQPEISALARVFFFGNSVFKTDQNVFAENDGICVDRDFFKIFTHKVKAGNPNHMFSEIGSLVVTQTMADKYFPQTNPIGQSINISRFGHTKDFKIVAVIEDVPLNSHLTFDFAASIEDYTISDLGSWARNQAYTYLRTDPMASQEKISSAAKALYWSHMPEEGRPDEALVQFSLQPLASIHLDSHLFRELSRNGNRQNIYLFICMAIFILGIAAINFVNLSTARAKDRAKEIGIRKTLGANRTSIIIQFLAETVLLSLISMLLATLLVYWYLPYFNQTINQSLSMDLRTLLPWLVACPLLVGILAGIYPALYLSAFSPSKVLKKQFQVKENKWLRSSLTVFQFALSSLLITGAFFIYKQLAYINEANLGLDKENVVYFSFGSSDALKEKKELLINNLMTHPNIISSTIGGNIPGGGDWGIPIIFEGYNDGNPVSFRNLCVDHNFLDTYGISLADGRDFSDEIKSDQRGAYIINETLAKTLQWKNQAVGKSMYMPVLGVGSGNVIGVIKDFNFRSLKEEIDPLVLFYHPDWAGIMSVKLGGMNIMETLEFIENQCQVIDPDFPINIRFFDDRIQSLYAEERQIQFIVESFTLLIIFISCIGLLGLTSFTIRQRTKELSIRKIIGATSQRLFLLVLAHFIKLISLGFVLAIPFSIYFINHWLDTFAFRIVIDPTVFVQLWALLILLALITTTYQILNVVRSNPVKFLRHE